MTTNLQDQGVSACPTGTVATHEPSPASGLGPSGECQLAGLPTEADHAVADLANVLWGRAINGPHWAVIAAQLARREGYLAGLTMAAEIAKRHKPDRVLKGHPLSRYDPEDREIIRAEENGEAIAAHCILAEIAKATGAA